MKAGTPHYDGASSSGVGKGYLEKPAAAMALRAACSGLQIQDSKQNKNKLAYGGERDPEWLGTGHGHVRKARHCLPGSGK